MTSIICLALCMASPGDRWPGFRGTGDSASDAQSVPLRWSDNEGIAFRADLSGYGQSSPVIWKDKVFVTSVEGDLKDRLWVECFSLANGKRIWAYEHAGTQKIKDSGYVSKASPTPYVDDRHVYAFFESGDLIALSHQGEKVWSRSLVTEFGAIGGAHGLGSSLAYHNGLLLVLVDHDGPSYLLAVDANSGKNRWKEDRPTGANWTSPLVVDDANAPTILVSGKGGVQSYSPDDGKALSVVGDLIGNNVPSPTVAENQLIIGSDKPNESVCLTWNKPTLGPVEWRATKASCTFGSPLVHAGHVYLVNRAGVAFCLDLKTGEERWTERIGSSCWASPVVAEGRVYFFQKDGKTAVVAPGATYQRLAENSLTLPEPDDRIYGVAVVDGAFVVRTHRHLWKLADSK